MPLAGLALARRYLRRRQKEERYSAWLVVKTLPGGEIATCLRGTVPLVLRASGEDIQKSSELNYGRRLVPSVEAKIADILGSYDRLVALTESVRADFRELGVADQAVVTIPNGVDVGRFRRDREVAELRTQLGWPNDRAVILTTGRNHLKKGFNLIPSMADWLRKAGYRFRWYVVGHGVDEIEEEIRARDLEDFVEAHGQVGVNSGPDSDGRFPDRKFVVMYQAADIYAFPSLLETFGMVQLEAMAAGPAVVSTDAPGCRDVVRHEENGLQAPAGDVEAFAFQLGRVLGDPHLRAKLSENARKAVEDYEWAKVAMQYEVLFRELIEQA